MRFSFLKKLQLISRHPAQRRIVALAAAIGVLFLCFGIFIYAPSRARMYVVKADLVQARSRLGELQSLVGLGRNIRDGISLVKGEYNRMQSKFPKNRSEGTQLITAYAAKFNIDIVSLKHFDVVPYVDEQGTQVIFDGRAVNSVPLSLEVKGFYKDLLEFILQMREELPGFVYVDTLKIVTDHSGDLKLNAVMDFNLFFLQENHGS